MPHKELDCALFFTSFSSRISFEVFVPAFDFLFNLTNKNKNSKSKYHFEFFHFCQSNNDDDDKLLVIYMYIYITLYYYYHYYFLWIHSGYLSILSEKKNTFNQGPLMAI